MEITSVEISVNKNTEIMVTTVQNIIVLLIMPLHPLFRQEISVLYPVSDSKSVVDSMIKVRKDASSFASEGMSFAMPPLLLRKWLMLV